MMNKTKAKKTPKIAFIVSIFPPPMLSPENINIQPNKKSVKLMKSKKLSSIKEEEIVSLEKKSFAIIFLPHR